MQFYALPLELLKWLSGLCQEQSWLLEWRLREHCYKILRASDLLQNIEEENVSLDGSQFFLGNIELCKNPKFSMNSNNIAELEFLESMCLQIVPALPRHKVLLEGSINSLKSSEYAGEKRLEFLNWRKNILRDFREELHKTGVHAAQVLPDGNVKIWRDTVISCGAAQWHRDGGKLKQFEAGPVEIVPDCSRSTPKR